MERDEPRVIDAKFKVIRPKRRYRLRFDWFNFIVISSGAASLGLVLIAGPGKHEATPINAMGIIGSALERLLVPR